MHCAGAVCESPDPTCKSGVELDGVPGKQLILTHNIISSYT